jgi:hypothetical protein
MALTTLADVKTALEIPTADESRDDAISDAITGATAAIARETKREFEATTSDTRLFGWKGTRHLDFEPYDLRTLTSLTLHPGDATYEETLTVDSDFVLMPVESEHGVYTRVRFAYDLLVEATTFSSSFGFVKCEVAGAWGFEAVPGDVARACIVTVSAWLEKGYAEQAADGWDEPRGTVPRPAPNFAIPGAAWRLLGPFARRQVY